MNETFT